MFSSGLLFGLLMEFAAEAGLCHGDCSVLSAPVRGVAHQPYQSSNFVVVALGGGYLLINVKDGVGVCG